jgi:hypothetical protein
MSSSYLERSVRLPTLAAVALTGAAVLPYGAAIAEVTVQPAIELRAEASSNPGLNPDSSGTDTEGGVADLALWINAATPRSLTTIRPRIQVREFSNRDVEPINAMLDFRTSFRSLRGQFDLNAGYERRDTEVAELPDAEFDDIDPDDPTTPETGRVLVGETRERADIRPRYAYQVSERTTIGSELLYQVVRYSSEAPDRVDYDYARADAFVSWAISERSDIQLGGYVSKYEATNQFNETDAFGGVIGLVHRWSETSGISAEMSVEENEVLFDPLVPALKTSGWAGKVTSYWQGEISEWRLTAGRNFTPSGRGGKTSSDQLRIQYNRDLSPRWQFTGAARLIRDESIITFGQLQDRDYARLQLSLKWKMTPTWFIRGGYTHTYQDRVTDPRSADDDKVFVSVGYLGLGPKRR